MKWTTLIVRPPPTSLQTITHVIECKDTPTSAIMHILPHVTCHKKFVAATLHGNCVAMTNLVFGEQVILEPCRTGETLGYAEHDDMPYNARIMRHASESLACGEH
jgi:hypothetical protein